VSEHVSAFVEHAREHYNKPLPRYVQRELRRYLACGLFSEGFARCHCDECGRDLLVAFSCKNEGICPSCAARRMCNGAAHLVDRVVPDVPVRQWVLSLPFELRRLAAFRADVLGAVSRIFYESIAFHYRLGSGVPNAHAGTITFVQRFGGSLNLNPLRRAVTTVLRPAKSTTIVSAVRRQSSGPETLRRNATCAAATSREAARSLRAIPDERPMVSRRH
jgi:hypothetical protein